jgi:hypothetical protein
MSQRARPPPAAVIAETKWLTSQWYFKPECQPILDRLHKDNVWHQLGKRDPAITRPRLIQQWSMWRTFGTGAAVLLAHEQLPLTGDIPDEKWSKKDLALRVAFLGSFFIAVSDVQTITHAELKKIRDSYGQEAERLRAEADTIRKYVGEAYASDFDFAAELSEDDSLWGGSDIDPRLIIRRRQAASHVQAYCVLLAAVMRGLYGTVLRRTTAAIATAALNRSVTVENIRYWCRV